MGLHSPWPGRISVMQKQGWGPASLWQICVRQLQGEDRDSSCSVKSSFPGCLRCSLSFIPCIKPSVPGVNTSRHFPTDLGCACSCCLKEVQWWPLGPAPKCPAKPCNWFPVWPQVVLPSPGMDVGDALCTRTGQSDPTTPFSCHRESWLSCPITVYSGAKLEGKGSTSRISPASQEIEHQEKSSAVGLKQQLEGRSPPSGFGLSKWPLGLLHIFDLTQSRWYK